jgi:large subunit ribosomal protein LP2
MNTIAAYLLCVLGGKAAPTVAEVTAVITAGGGAADEEKIALFFSEIEGKTIEELFALGQANIETCTN